MGEIFIQYYKRRWWIILLSFIIALGSGYEDIFMFGGVFIGLFVLFSVISLFIDPKRPK